MAEELDFENGRISNFQGLMILTLTLDQVIRYTVVHHSSTSTYIPNFIWIGQTFCGWTYIHRDRHQDALLGRLGGVALKTGDCPFLGEEVGRACGFLTGEWHEEWVNGNNQMPRNHVHCILGAKWSEQQVISMVKKQNKCIKQCNTLGPVLY